MSAGRTLRGSGQAGSGDRHETSGDVRAAEDIRMAEPKSSAWRCTNCDRLNAPFRKNCTQCFAPKDQGEEKTA